MPRKIPGRAFDSNTAITINNISFSNTVAINATSILVGNSTVNTFINATSVTTTALSGNGANVTSVNATTVGGNTASTLRSYSDTVSATAFTNAASRADSAYSNAASYADTKAATAYSNATSYADTVSATAFTNAASRADAAYTNAASYADTKAATAFTNAASRADSAYTNATSYADTKAATAFTNAASRADSAYSNAIAYSGNAVQAYNNAVAYAASNTYVNNTFLPLAGGTLTGNLTINATANVVSNLAANNVVIRGDIQIDGNLTVSGTSVTLNAASLAVEDNMIYLNNGSQVTHPDLGFAGNYNDGTYKHAGFFRDATDATWKVFDGYTPEPDASAYIDTSNASFRIANFTANVITANSFSGNGASVTSVDAATVGGNTASTLRSYSDTVAATAFSNAAARADSAYSNAASYADTKAATAYSNAISYSGNAALAYANAIAYSANATNISSGTVAFARLPALYLGTTQIQSSSAAQAVSGITTLAAGNTTITGFANVSSTLQVNGTTSLNGRTVVKDNVNADTSYPFGIQNGSQQQWWLRAATTSNMFAVHLNGTGDLFNIAANGNVGIGTASPGYALDLLSSTSGYITRLKSSSNYGGVLVDAGSSGSAGGGYVGVGKNGTRYGLIGVSGAYIGDSSTDLALAAESGSGIRLFSNGSGTESVHISSNGNVGIGTTAPGYKLHVVGKVYSSTEVQSGPAILGTVTASAVEYAGVGSNSGGKGIWIGRDFSSSYPDIVVAANGNVGVGTAAATSKFTIRRLESTNRTTYTDLLTLNADADNNPYAGHGGGILFRGQTYSGSGSNNTQGNRIWGQIGMYLTDAFDVFTGENMFFAVAPDDRSDSLSTAMTIRYNSHVGIGTTEPSTILDVGASQRSPTLTVRNDGVFSGGSGCGATIRLQMGGLNLFTVTNTGSGFRDGILKLFHEGTATISMAANAARGGDTYFNTGGNFGIGTTTPNVPLHVNKSGSSGSQTIVLGLSSDSTRPIIQFSEGADVNSGTGMAIEYDGRGFGGTNAIRINSVDNVSVFTVMSNSFVGINTTTPITHLHVASDGANVTTVANSTNGDMKGIVMTSNVNTNRMTGVWFSTGTDHSGTHWAGVAGARSDYATNWATHLSFYTHQNATTNITTATERMRIHGEGYVTTPYQPAFHAYGGQGVPNNYVVYPSVYVNRGSHYNTSTGSFTAPVAGLYIFFWDAIGSSASDVFRWYLRKNGTTVGAGDFHLRQDTGASGSEYATNGSRVAILNLAVNDYVQIFYTADGGSTSYAGADYVTFGGYLLG